MPINQTGAHMDTAANEYRDEWQEVPLASVADIRFSSVNKVSQPGEQPVRLCNYTDVYNNDYITADMDFMRATATRSEIERFVLQVGDVIITKDSETPDDIGIPAVVDTTAPDLVCGYHLALLRPNKDEVDPTFLAKQLAHHRIARYFGQQANGTTRYGISTAAIANTPLHLPRPDSQRSASALMRLVDTHITQTEAVIAKLKQVRAGMLHDLLSYGLDENGQLRDPIGHPEQFKATPLGRLPRGWDVVRLSERAGVFGGKRLPSGHSYADLPTGYRYLRVLDFFEKSIAYSELAILRKDTFAALRRYEICDGELFISIAGSLGCVGVLRPETSDRFILTENAARINIQKDFLPEFLCMFMNGQVVQRQINAEKGIGAGVPKLALHRIERLWVALPNPEEQESIITTAAHLDLQIEAEQIELNKLQKLKSGLQDDLLTGRVRVPKTIMEGAAVA